jgi:aerobic-type carbon monoxide dehydrogenase small subunit (CoxS/CutS family)
VDETGHRVRFLCNGEEVAVDDSPGASLLTALREDLGITGPKDGCAPQGQCGCCTVLVDGEPRVACVTPLARVEGRVVTTVEGLDPGLRDRLARALLDCGGSQCGFCTPGIIVRTAGLAARGRRGRPALDRALAAHLCRCTGWQSVYDALDVALDVALGDAPDDPPRAAPPGRDLDAATRRAEMEGGAPQRVAPDVPLGHGGFADDGAPRGPGVLVAVPCAPGTAVATVAAAGIGWVVAPTLAEARAIAGKVQGRRTTVDAGPPLPVPPVPPGGVALATSWVEPAYLEPDASWCAPGGDPADPLANGGAFGGKTESPVRVAARELADRLGTTVRTVFAREDVVRLGPKRPPVAATARFADGIVEIAGSVGGDAAPFTAPLDWPYLLEERATWSSVTLPGPPTAASLRAVGLAERAVLVEGALDAAGADRGPLVRDPRAEAVLLATCVRAPGGALAGAAVRLDARGCIDGITVRVAVGDPLDEVVLRSYVIGAAHMALGWVLTEGIAVDAATGEVHDLTIRSFGIVRAKDVPPVAVEIVAEPGPPLARASDAAFAAVAAAVWNAVSTADGARPESFPARGTRAARALAR